MADFASMFNNNNNASVPEKKEQPKPVEEAKPAESPFAAFANSATVAKTASTKTNSVLEDTLKKLEDTTETGSPLDFGAALSGALAKAKEKKEQTYSGVKTIVAKAKITADDFNYPMQPDKYSPEEVEKVKESFRILEDTLTNKEMVGQSVRNVLSLTRQNRALASSLLAPEDIRLVTAGLMQSYSVAIKVKRERATKKQENQEQVNKTVAGLMGGGFTL